ncbi:nicotinate phosphoribosyltransferase [Rhodohalobacter halophilus]|uniref:nicotinate phosphoribosyltransferase n=1 Tax=Rhodohalobacter halophilus TaxID=1812810 RepID=UPI00083F9308|nr:nicotinate phosphoribosyltransferase [Rhodohalobacter halophilus]
MYINKPASYTDYYELTMAQGYFLSGMHKKTAGFDYFFRNIPFNGGYVIFAGLNELVETIRNLTFSDEEIDYFRKEGFKEEFLEYLKHFTFTGNIYSVREGEVVFPSEPILRVEGDLLETQLLETLLLNILNFQSLIATKAARIKLAAGENSVVLDFGLRRSQGLGGIHATRAAMIGGFDGTSNVYSAQRFNVPAGGTMAHSWIQSFDSEIEAFRTYSNYYPDDTTLLVDTYDTLDSGVPNAIKIAKELEVKGHKLKAIRLDSGDLAYFSKKSRKLLDEAGLNYVKIAASNQLDERVIHSLRTQSAPIDIYGVGTRLVTGHTSPALDGVYKLNSIDGEPKLKISENIEKITLPGNKKVFRYLNGDGSFYGDAILFDNEEVIERMHHPTFPAKKSDLTNRTYEDLLSPVIKNGNIIQELPDVQSIAKYAKKRLKLLQPEYKRLDNPHIYKVGISTKLMEKRDILLKFFKS